VYGRDPAPIEDELFAMENMDAAVNRVDEFIVETLPERDPNVDFVSRLVYRIRDDRSIVRVEDAAVQSGLHIRTLQRLFGKYVGVSPKWVIQRYRLHEAAEWIRQGTASDWSKLSVELGYYDQSHFIRDFKAIIGQTPQSYVNEHILSDNRPS
jgi:AraC-like DNA-binding protein